MDPVVSKRALKTSLIVGTFLLCINLGNLILRIGLNSLIVFKGLLTYLVPYFVTTYTELLTQERLEPNTVVGHSGTYRCDACLRSGANHFVELSRGDTTPICSNAGADTEFVLYRND